MKIQSLLLASLLAPLCAVAQDKPAATQEQSPQQMMVEKAEALSEDQIKQSHDLVGLSALTQIYNSKGDTQRMVWTLRRVTELMPNSGDLKLQLAMAYTQINDKTKAYDTLLRMQVQGFGYDISKDPRFEAVHGTRVWDYLVANLAVNAKQFGEGKVAFELPSGDYLFNALAWDGKRGKLLVGSEREGKVYVADDNGKLTNFITADAGNGLWGVDALAVDGARNKLYVASAASPRFKGFNQDNAGKSGLFEFDLASGKLLKKYILPQADGAHVLTAIVAGKDGNVYLADGARREVFKLEGGALKIIVSNARLTGITGLALTDDGKTLYLADYAMGIFGYDLTKGAAFELQYDPSKLVLGGIDNLSFYDGNLIVVEGGMVPKRVMRIQLGADGHTVGSVMPLDVAQAAFANLGQAAVAGDNLYFVANRQDDLYDDNGVLTAANDLEPTSIFRSNLRYAWGQKGIATGGTIVPIKTADPGSYSRKPGVQPAAEKKDAAKPAGDEKH
jgi:sugar lactone lactonase YvrE